MLIELEAVEVCVNGCEMIFTKIDIPVRTVKKLPALNFARANLLANNKMLRCK